MHPLAFSLVSAHMTHAGSSGRQAKQHAALARQQQVSRSTIGRQSLCPEASPWSSPVAPSPRAHQPAASLLTSHTVHGLYDITLQGSVYATAAAIQQGSRWQHGECAKISEDWVAAVQGDFTELQFHKATGLVAICLDFISCYVDGVGCFVHQVLTHIRWAPQMSRVWFTFISNLHGAISCRAGKKCILLYIFNAGIYKRAQKCRGRHFLAFDVQVEVTAVLACHTTLAGLGYS